LEWSEGVGGVDGDLPADQVADAMLDAARTLLLTLVMP